MEIIANLPIEIQWKIFKFMRHPVADVFMNAEQVKKAIELAHYNANQNMWNGEQEQERWRVVFQRILL